MTGTAQWTVCSKIGPGRDYALHSLSDQARRLAPRTVQCIVGAGPGHDLHNSKSQGKGLELSGCAVHASEYEIWAGGVQICPWGVRK